MNLLENMGALRRRPTLAAAAFAAALALGGTSTAEASHRHTTVVIGACAPRYREPSCVRPCDSYAERERERGACAGKQAGFDAGFADGIRGSCYSDRPTASFCRVSEYFEQGYRAAFCRAYADGFERGKCERRCTPRHRW